MQLRGDKCGPIRDRKNEQIRRLRLELHPDFSSASPVSLLGGVNSSPVFVTNLRKHTPKSFERSNLKQRAMKEAGDEEVVKDLVTP